MSVGGRGRLAALARLIPATVACAAAIAMIVPATAGAWEPGPELYGVGERLNVPVTMSDGTVLRANVFYPTDPATGEPAAGPFPVLMVQTPFGKDSWSQFRGQQEGGAEAERQSGVLSYMVKRGYIDVVVDQRGTGDSHGEYGLFDPIQGRDGAELVRWAARLPNSNGRVGLHGGAAMGLNQFQTASEVGPNSPLKALFPISAASNTYRDLAFMGGIMNGEFDTSMILGAFAATHLLNPVEPVNPLDPVETVEVEADHVAGFRSWNLAMTANILTGGDQAYDEKYWQERAPRHMLARVIENRIPAFLVGGWFDVFHRGPPFNYAALQNLYHGRPRDVPMSPKQRVTGRYQLLQGPWYHLNEGRGAQIYRLQLAWFDRWLKGKRNGIDETTRPLHVHALGAGRWLDTSHYPFRETRPATYYLSGGPSGSGAPSLNDGTLTRAAPKATEGADRAVYTGASSPCSRASEQWGAGLVEEQLASGGLPSDPCASDDRTTQAGPGALTYTTEPMARDMVIAGPIAARVYATSTRPDVELVVTLEDIAPDGRSYPFGTGALLGSFRKLDPKLTWRGPDGRPTMPYHPYTKASVTPVKVGEVTRYDIEVFPTVAQIVAGHRLRLTLTTSETPHLTPIPEQAANLAGGVYEVQRNARAASYLQVPLAAPEAFGRCADKQDFFRFADPGGPATLACSVRKRSRPR